MIHLSKILLPQTRRVPVREDRPGIKTPLVLQTTFHPDLDKFLISGSRGDLLLRGSSSNGSIPSAFFPLEIEEEEVYLLSIVERLYTLGIDHSWGNAADLKVHSDLSTPISDFFSEYDLPWVQCLLGEEAYALLVKHNLVSHPSGKGLVSSSDSPEQLKEDFLYVGHFGGRAIHVVPNMGPFALFTTMPENMGFIVRMGDSVSLVLHNLERSHVICRLKV